MRTLRWSGTGHQTCIDSHKIRRIIFSLAERGRSVVTFAIIFLFFRRKAKIAFFALMTYAALC